MDTELRKGILERDDHECQLSKLFGIAHLSGVPCTEEKEVHHVTYTRTGHEQADDLISVCRRCHDFLTSYIRMLRYSRRSETIIEDNVEDGPPVKTLEKYDGNSTFPLDGDQPPDPPQWATCRPIEYLDEETKEGHFPTQED